MGFLLVAALLFGADYLCKQYVERSILYGEKKELLAGRLVLKKSHNTGFCMNLLSRKKEQVKMVSCVLFGALACVFLLALPHKKDMLHKTGLALMLGGAASNLYDRIKRGYVVDYVSVKKPKQLSRLVFNLGDVGLLLGSGLTILGALFEAKPDTEETA